MPIVSATHARCVYCLHDQKVPENVSRAVSEDAAVEAQLEDASLEGERRFADVFRASKGLQLFVFATAFLSAVWMLYMVFAHVSADDGKAVFIYGVVMVPALAFPVIPLLWLVILRRAKERRFAGLSFATVTVEGGTVRAGCPSCGVRLDTGSGVSVVCTHCDTESLLPRPLVDASLRRRHARVVELRIQGKTAAQDATKDAVATWQQKVVPMILGFNVVIGLLIAAAVIAYQLAAP